MEIFKDEISGLEYICFDDVLDENIELDNISKLLINGSINEYIHSLMRKFITFNCVIGELKYQEDHNIFTHDEIVICKAKFKDFYYDLKYEYDESKEKDGIWKYINNITIENIYTKSFPYKDLQLVDIFEDDNFYINIMNIKED